MTFFDRTARFALVDCKLGHVLWGFACGAAIGVELPMIVLAIMFIGGMAGMISCGIYERIYRADANLEASLKAPTASAPIGRV